MNALVRKEIRMLLPAWAVAMVLVIGALCLSPVSSLPVWTIASLALGAIFLALLPFGQECSLGTFSNLLAQPVPRKRLWQVKTRVLAVALLSVLVVVLAGIGLRSAGVPGQPSGWVLAVIAGVVALASCAGGLWTTLLFRQIAAAFWFTLLLPLALLMMTAGMWGRLHHPADTIVIVILLVLYSIAGWWWARRQFFRAQDTQWTGGTIALPRISWRSGAGRPAVHRSGPIGTLVRKELQLHQSAYLVAALLLLFHIVVLFARLFSTDSQDRGEMFGMVVDAWWVLWLALPLIIGAACTAEERRLETQPSQLCLPVKRRTQTAVKFGVALFLGVSLGAVFPALLEGLGAALGATNHILELTRGDPVVSLLEFLWLNCLASAAIVLVSLYASALSRHTLQAIGATGVIGVPLAALTYSAVMLELRAGHSSALIGWIGVPILLVTVLVLAFHGAIRLRVGWDLWWRHAFGLVLVCAFIVLATAAVHDRAWERVMHLEPRAGAAQLTGAVRPQIHTDFIRGGPMNLWVLLPDGRLWTELGYHDEVAYHYYDYQKRALTPAVIHVPQGGTFLGTSNWVAMAGTYTGTVGLQSDGTLWRISAHKGLEQIGTASDWSRVVAGHGFFLALKTDGTLWGWGHNHSGQLGPPLKQIVEDPVRIGTDDDWVQVFASGVSTGIKRDGSAWRWGHFPYGTKSAEPVRWAWEATNWQLILSPLRWPAFEMMLHNAGTLWVRGPLPRKILGHSTTAEFTIDPIQLGRHSDWNDLQSGFGSIGAIRGNQLIFQSQLDHQTVPWLRRIWKPSRRSDWIAITSVGETAFVALAADGTLAMWGHPYREPAGIAGLLAPSRKPWWTVNVLDAAQDTKRQGR